MNHSIHMTLLVVPVCCWRRLGRSYDQKWCVFFSKHSSLSFWEEKPGVRLEWFCPWFRTCVTWEKGMHHEGWPVVFDIGPADRNFPCRFCHIGLMLGLHKASSALDEHLQDSEGIQVLLLQAANSSCLNVTWRKKRLQAEQYSLLASRELARLPCAQWEVVRLRTIQESTKNGSNNPKGHCKFSNSLFLTLIGLHRLRPLQWAWPRPKSFDECSCFSALKIFFACLIWMKHMEFGWDNRGLRRLR